MTGIGSKTHSWSSTQASPTSLGLWLDTKLDAFLAFMTSILCRASRGYLCPPDMTSIMYPDDPPSTELEDTTVRRKGCCHENLSGK